MHDHLTGLFLYNKDFFFLNDQGFKDVFFLYALSINWYQRETYRYTTIHFLLLAFIVPISTLTMMIEFKYH